MAEQPLQEAASEIRMTIEQAEALHRLLALLRQPAVIASTGEPIHWLEVTTEAQTWTIDDRGGLVGWKCA